LFTSSLVSAKWTHGVASPRPASADEVLDGFHVVVGGRVVAPAVGLELFDDGGVLAVEVLVQGPQRRAIVGVERQGRRLEVGERAQVLDLDADAGAHQRAFAGVLDERLRVAGVAAVEGGDGVERTPVGHTRVCGHPGKERVGRWIPRPCIHSGHTTAFGPPRRVNMRTFVDRSPFGTATTLRAGPGLPTCISPAWPRTAAGT
jgi:hypothetical protein